MRQFDGILLQWYGAQSSHEEFKDSFRKKAKKFVVIEGSLYYKGKSDIDLKVIASISDMS